ncbi:hypothetical protein D9757_004165 [Collybiopsis confluens]|uniref:SANT domain-containing protein n=1 Tax=Collybiopsis confluens TaxID=2823264 RepID=A0A8H5HTY8_9AGAR|nr:hypothetical protein D9757_004165 [Collybiopsis confluens]
MGSGSDTRPISIPSGSGLPPRPSFDYERPIPTSPSETWHANHSPSYNDPYARYTTGRYSDPYRDYQRAPSPGVFERYRDVSVNITWNKSTTWYHPRGIMNQDPQAETTVEGIRMAVLLQEHLNPLKFGKESESAEIPKSIPRIGLQVLHLPQETMIETDIWKRRRGPQTVLHICKLGQGNIVLLNVQVDHRTHTDRSPLTPTRGIPARLHAHQNGAIVLDPAPELVHGRALTRDLHHVLSPVHLLVISPGYLRALRHPSMVLLWERLTAFKMALLRTNRSPLVLDEQQESSVKPSTHQLSDPNGGKSPVVDGPDSVNETESSPSQLPSDYSLGRAGAPLSIPRTPAHISILHLDTTSDTPAESAHVAESPPLDTLHTDTSSKAESAIQDIEVGGSAVPEDLVSREPANAKTGAAAYDPVVTTPRDPIAAPPETKFDPIIPLDTFELEIEDIPDMSTASTVRDAVRIVVMRRLLVDRQSRQERVDPVLFSNLTLAPPADLELSFQERTINILMTEMTHPESERFKVRRNGSEKLKQSLVEKFEERQGDLKAKVQKLKEEYIFLHEKWKVHCATLDRQAKAKSDALEGKPPSTNVAPPTMTGRTTRRSAASLGDAVRSDLEMEQIIASLGSNEATDPNQLCLRNVAVIPDMVSVIKGKIDYVYDDNNLRVEDPLSYYAPQTEDWTEEEKQIFIDKFAIFPKQFGAISRFLPNKTTAQCVDFYYLHKNVDIDFKNVVAMKGPGRKGKRRTAKRKANALLADIRKHDAEVSASGTTARATPGKGRAKRMAPPVPLAVAVVPTPILPPESSRRSSLRRPTVHLESTPTSATATPTPEPEARPKRRRVATVRASLGATQNESEEVASVSISEPEPELEPRPTKKPRRNGRRVKSAAMVSDDFTEDSSTPPPVDPGLTDPAYIARQKVNSEWGELEKELFLKLLSEHGFDALKIASVIPTKSASQCSDYYHANEAPLGFRKMIENHKKALEDAKKFGNGKVGNRATPGHAFAPGPFPDMASYFAHPHFPRFTTGVSPYGANTPGVPPPFSPAYGAAYFHAPVPPGSTSASYTGRPYLPYPLAFPPAGYPSMGMSPAATTGTAGTQGIPGPFPPNTSYYPGYSR